MRFVWKLILCFLLALAAGFGAAFVLSGRHDDARQAMSRLRELEPGLTAGVLRQRYPGRDSPQAGRFIGALVEAGLPL